MQSPWSYNSSCAEYLRRLSWKRILNNKVRSSFVGKQAKLVQKHTNYYERRTEKSVSSATKFLWFGKFWDGREDIHDNEWAGRPHTSRTDDNIAAVHTVLQHNRQSMVRLLEEQLHINRETIRHIITEDLGKKNLHSLRATRINGAAKSRPYGLVRRPSCSASLRLSIFDHNCDGGRIVVFYVRHDY